MLTNNKHIGRSRVPTTSFVPKGVQRRRLLCTSHDAFQRLRPKSFFFPSRHNILIGILPKSPQIVLCNSSEKVQYTSSDGRHLELSHHIWLHYTTTKRYNNIIEFSRSDVTVGWLRAGGWAQFQIRKCIAAYPSWYFEHSDRKQFQREVLTILKKPKFLINKPSHLPMRQVNIVGYKLDDNIQCCQIVSRGPL